MPRTHQSLGPVMVALALLLAPARSAAYQMSVEEEDLADPVTELRERIAAGEVALRFDSAQGYLSSLLEALDISVASQGLVFSRTSLQTDRISPWTPRAIYFNDDVYVGFVQESPILEIASIDPDGGASFYTLIQEERDEPGFTEESTACLMCHDSRTVTGGVPGVMVRSVLVDRFGYMVAPLHEGASADRTPFSERLGGWYVTGSVGPTVHAGNSMAPELSHEITDATRYLESFDMHGDSAVFDLSDHFDAEPYLSPYSDLVALLVLTHQTRVHNLISLTHEATREALREQDLVLRTTGQEPPEDGLLPTARVRVDGAIDRLLREMLFVRAAPLEGPIEGSSGFAEEFEARGPFDSQGRSLRALDLQSRLFRYPFSFLIYTDAFAALPDVAKRLFYTRLRAVLDGEDTSGDFDHLTPEDRAAIDEILADTKPEFAEMTGG